MEELSVFRDSSFLLEPKSFPNHLIYETCFNTDKKVGEKVRIIDKEQFGELIRTHQTAMYRYALGMLKSPADAEDAVSEAILKAYKHLEQLRNPFRFKSWIITIFSDKRDCSDPGHFRGNCQIQVKQSQTETKRSIGERVTL